jgi:hypothetical protein
MIRIYLSKSIEAIRMRKIIYLFLLMPVLLMGTGNLYAADLKDGFFDLAWKTNLAEVEGFRKISENSGVSYFVNPKRAYKIADVKIMDVAYGTFANQFFAVYIHIHAIDVFAQLRRYINNKYGLPRIKINKMGQPDQQRVYQWKHKQAKIKLKIYRNKEPMKMAFYYSPLSAQVNEAQLEAFQETNKRPIFPLDKSQRQQAEEMRDFMRF